MTVNIAKEAAIWLNRTPCLGIAETMQNLAAQIDAQRTGILYDGMYSLKEMVKEKKEIRKAKYGLHGAKFAVATTLNLYFNGPRAKEFVAFMQMKKINTNDPRWFADAYDAYRETIDLKRPSDLGVYILWAEIAEGYQSVNGDTPIKDILPTIGNNIGGFIARTGTAATASWNNISNDFISMKNVVKDVFMDITNEIAKGSTSLIREVKGFIAGIGTMAANTVIESGKTVRNIAGTTINTASKALTGISNFGQDVWTELKLNGQAATHNAVALANAAGIVLMAWTEPFWKPISDVSRNLKANWTTVSMLRNIGDKPYSAETAKLATLLTEGAEPSQPVVKLDKPPAGTQKITAFGGINTMKDIPAAAQSFIKLYDKQIIETFWTKNSKLREFGINGIQESDIDLLSQANLIMAVRKKLAGLNPDIIDKIQPNMTKIAQHIRSFHRMISEGKFSIDQYVEKLLIENNWK